MDAHKHFVVTVKNYLTVQHTCLVLKQNVYTYLRYEVVTLVTKKVAIVTTSIFSECFISHNRLFVLSMAHTYFSSFLRC